MIKKILLLAFCLLFMQNIQSVSAKSIDDIYLFNMKTKIESNWINYDNKSDNSTVVNFKVDRTGTIFDVNIIRSSGNENFDKSAIMAVYKAAPFKPFSKGTISNTLTMNFFFSPKNTFLNVADTPNYSHTSSQFMQILDNVNYGYYFYNLKQRISSNWDVKSYYENKSTITLLKINKEGLINSLNIIKSSGDKNFDSDVIDAIKKSVPFDIFPKKSEKESLNLQLSFYYTSLKPRIGESKISCCFLDYNTDLMVDYENYKKQVEKVLSTNLPKKMYKLKRKVLLKLTIDKTGKISCINIEKPSKSKAFDKKMIKAVNNKSFPAIPTSLNKKDFSFLCYLETSKKDFSRGFISGFLNYVRNPISVKCIWDKF